MEAKCNIPMLDLQDFTNQLSKLIAACEEWGCFRLLNFNQVLPATLMSEMKEVVRSLFDLPEEIKRRNVELIPGTGYIAPSAKNLNEALGLHNLTSPSGVDEFCSQLSTSPLQREITVRYCKAVHRLLMVISKELAKGLGVSRENIGFEKWPCLARINKYHFTPETVGNTGVPTHTDSGFLTILQDDQDIGGLQVMNKSGEFIAVDPWPGTLLVNLGDLAKVWSNGRFRSVKHRVQCKQGKTRVSIASFLFGHNETVMEPPPELVDDEHPRVYVPTTFEDYRKLRFSTKLHAGEALELLYTPSFVK